MPSTILSAMRILSYIIFATILLVITLFFSRFSNERGETRRDLRNFPRVTQPVNVNGTPIVQTWAVFLQSPYTLDTVLTHYLEE